MKTKKSFQVAEQVTVTARFIDMKNVNKNGKDFILLSFDIGGKPIKVATSDKQLSDFNNDNSISYRDMLTKDCYLNVTYNKHIAGVTGYEKNGEITFHEGNGNHLEMLYTLSEDDRVLSKAQQYVERLGLQGEEKINFLLGLINK